MATTKWEKHRDYVLYILRKAKETMEEHKNALGEYYSKRMEEIIKNIEEGKFRPFLVELGPRTIIKWHRLPGSPVTHISTGIVRHIGKLDAYRSVRLYARHGFHILGRFPDPTKEGEYLVGYLAVDLTSDKPKLVQGSLGNILRVIDRQGWYNSAISRIHGILAPHPEKENRVIYIHLGKNLPRIIKKIL